MLTSIERFPLYGTLSPSRPRDMLPFISDSALRCTRWIIRLLLHTATHYPIRYIPAGISGWGFEIIT